MFEGPHAVELTGILLCLPRHSQHDGGAPYSPCENCCDDGTGTPLVRNLHGTPSLCEGTIIASLDATSNDL